MSQPDCLFCSIVSGDIPADIVHRDERVVAFRDISPQAPTHVLVIPAEHIESLDAADDAHGALLGHVMLVARDLARSEGLSEGGYRTVINTGVDGGQTVHHIHVHLLGGRALSWPPG
jgi:histidine triad (HIT) family protein